MAVHYREHPAVIGWQIDNELNCEIAVFYADADHAAFRDWAGHKYGTLDALNRAWGTVFWNQTYTAWDQVYLTRPTVSDSPNPHQALDEKRFISDNTISYAKLQADIIREEAPGHWVTTNGIFGHLDYHRMTEESLDFISYDSYPLFGTIFPDAGDSPLLDRKWSLNLSVTRSVSPNFGIMEQQSGPGGWVNRIEVPSPYPGQMRLWTYQSIMHGADLLLYFRWRTATVGTEMYWHGINDYHNKPNRRLAEAGAIGAELERIGERIVGATFRANVAIVKDYDNEWDGELDNWHGPMERASVEAWFKALQHRHIPVDILYMRESTSIEDLLRYDVLFYPHPTILTAETAALLESYAQRGGNVVFGCRTGYKDQSGRCYMLPFPGPAAGMCGITVEDFTIIAGKVAAPAVRFGEDGEEPATTTADKFNDVIHVEDPSVEVVATYASSYYAGKPALTRRRTGQGFVWYYGAAFNEKAANAVIDGLSLRSPLEGVVTLPEQVELGIRDKEGESYAFLLNYGERPADLVLHQEFGELLQDRVMSGTVRLEPYGVLILKLS
jgi:beta-galactosidase